MENEKKLRLDIKMVKNDYFQYFSIKSLCCGNLCESPADILINTHNLFYGALTAISARNHFPGQKLQYFSKLGSA